MKVHNSGLTVSYAIPLIFALGVWLLGWGILWKLLPNNGELPKNSPGAWFDIMFWAAVLSINGLLGPILALKYSYSIRLESGNLLVRRYFGLFEKRYAISDIIDVNLVAPDAKTPRVKIDFMNGDTIIVNGLASHFQEFCRILVKR